MTPNSPPFSQTGLVPTSHKKRRDLLSCIDQWKRLPPRPPPELYPFKGDYVHQNRKNLKQFVKRDQAKKPPAEKDKDSNHEMTRLSIGSREKPLWDPFQNDLSIHQFDTSKRNKFKQSRSNSLDFIRKSAGRRDLLIQYQQQLEMDLAREGWHESVSDYKSHEATHANVDRKNFILDELMKLKSFMKEVVENDENDVWAVYNDEESCEEGDERIFFDHTDTTENEAWSTESGGDNMGISLSGMTFLKPDSFNEEKISTFHKLNENTSIPIVNTGVLHDCSSIQLATKTMIENKKTSKLTVPSSKKENDPETSESQQINPTNIEKSDVYNDGVLFKKFASAIADSILATISI